VKKSLKHIVNFFFEVGILSKTPRTGFHFLGSGEQSVAEHINRVTYVGYVLSMMEKDVDSGKVIKMCLFHDLAEARTSDLNYVHQKYSIADEEKAIADLVKTLPFGDDILSLLKEHQGKKTKEALLAKDADTIEWILSLKENLDTGNVRAQSWIQSAVKRLKTNAGKQLAQEIIETSSYDWFDSGEDDWWVNRDQKVLKKRF
jgi:putative hydrolase of HD superfamily